MTASMKREYVRQIDEDILSKIGNNINDAKIQELTIRWTEAVQKEASLSEMLWNKKKEFFNSDKHLMPIDSPYKNMRNRLPPPVYSGASNNRRYRKP